MSINKEIDVKILHRAFGKKIWLAFKENTFLFPCVLLQLAQICASGNEQVALIGQLSWGASLQKCMQHVSLGESPFVIDRDIVSHIHLDLQTNRPITLWE